MKLTIYSVYPAGRNWTEWLSEAVSEGTIRRENYHEARWYGDEGRFIVLVHHGDELRDDNEKKALDIEEKWAQLPDSVRRRVFWLIYSGSGFWRLRSHQPNIHYLRFLIGTSIDKTDKSRLRMFCQWLKKDEDADPINLWGSIYPNENVHAATLLAILAADEIGIDISSAVRGVLNDAEMLHTAYREFAAHAKSESVPPNLASWFDDLERHDYNSIRTQLREVLGGVPD